MYEIIAFVYLLFMLGYFYFAYKKYGYENKDLLTMVGKPMASFIGEKKLTKMVSKSNQLKLSKLYNPKDYEKGLVLYQTQRIGVFITVVTVIGFIGLILGQDYKPSKPIDYVLERPAYGQGDESIEAQYELSVDGKLYKQNVQVELNQQIPDQKRAMEVLLNRTQDFEVFMLADNEGLNHVKKDLRFIEMPFAQEPIQVRYESSNEQIVTSRGQIKYNLLEENKAYPVQIKTTFTYGEAMLDRRYTITVIKESIPQTTDYNNLSSLIVEHDEDVTLPKEIDNGATKVKWYASEVGMNGFKVFLLGIVIGYGLYLLKEYELNQMIVRRQEEILLDFPSVVNKLTILINAGMTFSRAWHKIVEDYQKSKTKDHVLYEEMVNLSSELAMGVPEITALENFGRRCRSIEVIRMASILSQNLKRGSHSLTIALKALSIEAWSIRTSNAKKLGEKASTKLLIPMAISLLTVLLVVMAPTFMQMQL